ncbi:MAG: hypothetical protein OXI87_10360 [Albidovulum sp.]|nr:hypothetical protein [Albidovulum sp.]
MGTKPNVVKLQKTEILSRNTKIDARVVSAQARLERELKGLGVEIKPEFKVEPPLGRGTTRLSSQNF